MIMFIKRTSNVLKKGKSLETSTTVHCYKLSKNEATPICDQLTLLMLLCCAGVCRSHWLGLSFWTDPRTLPPAADVLKYDWSGMYTESRLEKQWYKRPSRNYNYGFWAACVGLLPFNH